MKLIKIFLTLFFFSILLNSCQKEYSVENGGLKLAAGNWEFIDSAQSYFGNMDTAYIVTTGTTKELHLDVQDAFDEHERLFVLPEAVERAGNVGEVNPLEKAVRPPLSAGKFRDPDSLGGDQNRVPRGQRYR